MYFSRVKERRSLCIFKLYKLFYNFPGNKALKFATKRAFRSTPKGEVKLLLRQGTRMPKGVILTFKPKSRILLNQAIYCCLRRRNVFKFLVILILGGIVQLVRTVES